MSGLESIGTPPEKVGVSQQWYDELDNLAFSQEQEISEEEEKEVPHEDLNDDRIHIDCCVTTSPGTSEVATLQLGGRNGISSGSSVMYNYDGDGSSQRAVSLPSSPPEFMGRTSERSRLDHVMLLLK